MVEIRITQHAIDRYVERIGGSRAQARAVLDGHAVHVAAEFGARVVRLPAGLKKGGRIILELKSWGATVVTVVPIGHLPCQLLPVCQGGLQPSAFDHLHPVFLEPR